MYDYGWRFYDPARPGFTTMDPHAENYYSISPYAYVANNPMRLIDPDGRDILDGIIEKAASAVKTAAWNCVKAAGQMVVQSAKSALEDTKVVAKGDITVTIGPQIAETTQIDNKGTVGMDVSPLSIDLIGFETETTVSSEGITAKNEFDFIGKDGEIEASTTLGGNVLAVNGSIGGEYQLKDGKLSVQSVAQGGIGVGSVKKTKDLKTGETTISTGFAGSSKYAVGIGLEVNASLMLQRKVDDE